MNATGTARAARTVARRELLAMLETRGYRFGTAGGLVWAVALAWVALPGQPQGLAGGWPVPGWVPAGLTLLLYTTLVLYGSAMSSGVAAEKGSRVMEVLLAAVPPEAILRGKLLGVGAASALQYLLWAAAGATAAWLRALAASGGGSGAAGPPLEGTVLLPPWLAGYLVLFFALGFGAFGPLFAAAGSLASGPEDVSQLTWPPFLLILGGYVLATAAFLDPHGPWAMLGSLLPFLGPLVMFTRLCVAAVPAWQVAACVAVSAGTAALALKAAESLFRRSVLRARRTSWLEGLKEGFGARFSAAVAGRSGPRRPAR